MLLNTIETVAENEEPGLKCLSMTVQRDDKVEYLHFGETPGKNSDSVLLAKERFNISSKYIYIYILIGMYCIHICTCFSLHSTDEGYQELCKLSNLPSLHELKMKVQELNSMWDIRPTPVGTDGVQQSFRGRLIVRLEHLLRNSAEDAIFKYVCMFFIIIMTI